MGVHYNGFMWTLRRLQDFISWLAGLSDKNQRQVEARLARIEDYGHFGDFKHIEGSLFELRFKNGNRIYYFRTGKAEITLISGGDKNDQDRDIKKAKTILDE